MNQWRSSTSSSNIGDYSSSSSSSWSRVQDKMFERALVDFPEETPDRWEKIARQVPGKSAMEVCQHFEDLVHDLMEIDAGRVELPSYEDELDSPSQRKQRETERRKGVPWTEEEHRLFLTGLQRYGKGDWRSISRNAVVSRTPTQVASHAQKYFLRLNSIKKDKKRSSIHDITTTDTNSLGQTNDQNCVGMLADQSTIDTLDPTSFFNDQRSSPGYQGFGFRM